MNPDITKIIEQYLAGELSSSDQNAFEERMASNPALQEEVAFQRTIHEAAKRAALRADVKQAAKGYHFLKNLKWGGLGGAILAIVALSSALVLSSGKNKTQDRQMSEEMIQLTEELKESGPIENLESEFFAWNATDTAFLSKDGILISVPENALLLNGEAYNDPAIIQWQEALDGATIMKSGLSTTSNGELLETAGMFSFSAKTEKGEELTIDPSIGVYVQVPVDEYKEGMQLFEGEKDSLGVVNWVKPRPLEKIPVPVAMSELDFYPPDYETKLDELKARKAKKYRDSLYLSFETDFYPTQEEVKEDIEQNLAVSKPAIVLPQRKIDAEEMYLIYGENRPIGSNMNFYEAFVIMNENKFVPGDLILFPIDYYLNDPMGKIELFNIAERTPALKDYLIEKGIIRVDLQSGASSIQTIDATAVADSAETEAGNYIRPSSVLGFWNNKFNNTLLSTHEFEARMKVIHRTCDQSLLALYIQNLNKPMHELDAKAVAKGYSAFKTFEAEHIGALNMDDPHLNGLEEFYETAVRQLIATNSANQSAESDRRAAWNKEIKAEREKEKARSSVRNAQVFNEEYALNHRNVRKQLGRVLGAKIYGASPICNIDRFVKETTLARKTGKFYDQVTGKTAIIKYNPFTFKVKDHEKYERIFAYLLPDKLNSYHRLDDNNGTFNYSLNDALKYDLAIVGIGLDGFSFVKRIRVKQGDLGTVTLHPISEVKMNNTIYDLNKKRGMSAFDVVDELKWLQKEQRNYVELKRQEDERIFRAKVRPSIYPCAQRARINNNDQSINTYPQ